MSMRIAMGVVLACAVASASSARAEPKQQAGVFVTLTPVADVAERTSHIDCIRARLSASPLLENKHVDVNVTRLTWVTVGSTVEVQLELAFVMSNTNNEIVSLANQTAKLVLSKSQFRLEKLPSLRREVIDSALGDLLFKLRRAAIARSV